MGITEGHQRRDKVRLQMVVDVMKSAPQCSASFCNTKNFKAIHDLKGYDGGLTLTDWQNRGQYFDTHN